MRMIKFHVTYIHARLAMRITSGYVMPYAFNIGCSGHDLQFRSLVEGLMLQVIIIESLTQPAQLHPV